MMRLPTERISLNRGQNAVILTGLNRILNEFGTLLYSRRLAPDEIYLALKDKLQPRALAPGTYELILSVRNRLASVADKERGKYRLTVIEYAILAFALRVARRVEKRAVPEKLGTKLEKYRKRAKRRAIALCGREEYKEAARQWACSARWIRFNLLPLAPKGIFFVKPLRLYRQQFCEVRNLAQAVIAERCTKPVPDQDLSRLIRLIVREVRRKHHPGTTVRELLRDEPKAQDFLFKLIRKKQPDLSLKFEFKSLCEQQAERGERFRRALVSSPAGSAAGVHDELRFPLPLVLEHVASFLRLHINRTVWEQVAAVAAAIAKNSGPLSPENFVSRSLTVDEVMRASKPPWKPRVGSGEVEYFAAWLLHFLVQCGFPLDRAMQSLKEAMELAGQVDKLGGKRIPPEIYHRI